MKVNIKKSKLDNVLAYSQRRCPLHKSYGKHISAYTIL